MVGARWIAWNVGAPAGSLSLELVNGAGFGRAVTTGALSAAPVVVLSRIRRQAVRCRPRSWRTQRFIGEGGNHAWAPQQRQGISSGLASSVSSSRTATQTRTSARNKAHVAQQSAAEPSEEAPHSREVRVGMSGGRGFGFVCGRWGTTGTRHLHRLGQLVALSRKAGQRALRREAAKKGGMRSEGKRLRPRCSRTCTGSWLGEMPRLGGKSTGTWLGEMPRVRCSLPHYLTTKGFKFDHQTPIRTSFDQRFNRSLPHRGPASAARQLEVHCRIPTANTGGSLYKCCAGRSLPPQFSRLPPRPPACELRRRATWPSCAFALACRARRTAFGSCHRSSEQPKSTQRHAGP